MSGLTHIHQCPRCELRYTSSSELEYHLSNDHHPRVHVEDKPATVITAPVASAPAEPDPNDIATTTSSRVRGIAIFGLVAAAMIVLAAFTTSTLTLLIVIALVLALAGLYAWRARGRARYYDIDPSDVR